jgi:hypothetical protein
MIEHRHWVLGKNEKDGTAERMASADAGKVSDHLWFELVQERINDVKKIAAYLNQSPDWSVVETQGGII